MFENIISGDYSLPQSRYVIAIIKVKDKQSVTVYSVNFAIVVFAFNMLGMTSTRVGVWIDNRHEFLINTICYTYYTLYYTMPMK